MVEKNSTESVIIKKKPVLPINDSNHDAKEELKDKKNDKSPGAKAENASKIKYLPPSVIKDIEQKNVARKLAGLPPILTRIRHCLTCGAKFQSAGNRTCGCASRVAGIIAGREII